MIEQTRLTHDALFYGSDAEFVSALAPFLRDGLEQGHGAVAAVTRSNIDLLRDALGPDAGSVAFIDRDDWYQRPATTVAGWQRLLGQATRQGQDFVRIVGEVGFGPSDRHPTWTRYESALNRVFADAPAWIICPYDTRALPADTLEQAHRTHPVVSGPDRRDSDRYQAPEDLLRSLREPLPPVAGPPAIEMTLDNSVAAARHRVRDAVTANGSRVVDRLGDVLLALSEIVANSLVHGSGRRQLRVWGPYPDLVCEVTDEGAGPSDPLAGYVPPDGLRYGGRGLWIVHQLCDALAIDTHDGHTRVRFALNLAPAGLPAGAAAG